MQIALAGSGSVPQRIDHGSAARFRVDAAPVRQDNSFVVTVGDDLSILPDWISVNWSGDTLTVEPNCPYPDVTIDVQTVRVKHIEVATNESSVLEDVRVQNLHGQVADSPLHMFDASVSHGNTRVHLTNCSNVEVGSVYLPEEGYGVEITGGTGFSLSTPSARLDGVGDFKLTLFGEDGGHVDIVNSSGVIGGYENSFLTVSNSTVTTLDGVAITSNYSPPDQSLEAKWDKTVEWWEGQTPGEKGAAVGVAVLFVVGIVAAVIIFG